jgi:4a-hydroxytetrahydrobiopterin dehydratase
MTDLKTRRCQPCEGGIPALDLAAATRLQQSLDRRWKLINDGERIAANFSFGDYWRTTAFVNAVAWIAHTEDHHPDITFGYNQATVTYWTHAVGGLTENDFICAAKVDALLPD